MTDICTANCASLQVTHLTRDADLRSTMQMGLCLTIALLRMQCCYPPPAQTAQTLYVQLMDTDSTSQWRWLHQHPHRVHPHQESSPLHAEASNGPSWRLAAATCHFLRYKVAVKLGQGAFATLHRQIYASGEGTFLTCEKMSALVILHQAPSSEQAVRIR